MKVSHSKGLLFAWGCMCLLLAACSSPSNAPDLTDEGSLRTQAVAAGAWTTRYSNALGWHTKDFYYETIRFPDINGDGRADVCGRFKRGLECNLSNGVNRFVFRILFNNYSDAQGWHLQPSFWKTIQYPDINGDGRDDVCGRNKKGILCAVTNASGTGFGAPSQWSVDDDFSDALDWGSHPGYWSTIRFPDVNGDGRDDVCGRGADGMNCALAKVSGEPGFDKASLWTPSLAFGDLDGWKAFNYYYGTIRFADLNADGKSDVCGRGPGGVVCGLSTGRGFGPVRLWTSQYRDAAHWHTSPAYWSTIQLADINNDRKADICGRGFSGMHCGLSTGFSFIGTQPLHVPQFNDANGWNKPQHYTTIRVVDASGDRKADICGRGTAGIHCAYSTSTSSVVRFSFLHFRVDSFRDRDGWGNVPSFWKTLKPANVDNSVGAEFCGRGAEGIFCSLD